MNSREGIHKKKASGRIGLLVGLAAAIGLAAFVAMAQDFRAFRSTGERTALPTASPTSGGAGPDQFNNSGRAFLRWWNPVLTNRTLLDNDQSFVGAPGGTSDAPTGTWIDPRSNSYTIWAAGYQQNGAVTQPYRMVKSVAQTPATEDPRSGANARYRWQFTGLVPGQSYRLSLSIPIGPTMTNPPAYLPSDYPQRYYVVDVQGAVDGAGDPEPDDVQVVDTFAVGGGFVRLGNDGNPTDKLYTAGAGGTLTINLYNTVPRNSQGQFIDADALPGLQWVYADAALIETNVATAGGYTAQPVVHELDGSDAPSDAQLRRRVVGARNESLASGSLGRQVNIAALTSYIYNGALANVSQGNRLNLAWSWPVRRPVDGVANEQTRYAAEREAWIAGPVAGNERHTQRVVQDNTSATTVIAGPVFTPTTAPTATPFLGADYLEGLSTNGAPTGEVRFRANVPNGNWNVQIYLPTTITRPNMANGVLYELYAGATLIDTFLVDQQSARGWFTLPGQPAAGYEQTTAGGRLMLRVTNSATSGAGDDIVVDAVRWVRPATLAVSSTPVAAITDIRTAPATTSSQDVVVAAMEDGRIYAIDGAGSAATGAVPATYWTYPSPNPASDPNSALTEDGGVAEVPTGFGKSSGLIATVGGADYLFIASNNGRVYCIEMEGRGDGTTRRRWSWPNDYDPTNPAGPRQAPIDPVLGSITLGEVSGAPAIFVATQDGIVYALDAAGTAANKTTTVLWTADLSADPIATTPIYSAGKVYVAADVAGNGTVFCLDANTGTTDWTSADTFDTFADSSPILVPGAQITGPGPNAGQDALFVADQSGEVASINPADGTTRWSAAELAGGPSAGLNFAYLTVANNTGTYTPSVAALLVPTLSGSIVGLYADGSLNRLNNRRIYQFNVANGPVSAMATGGWRTGDLRSWIYAGDARGIFYAFNGNNDIDQDPITPGEQPGQQEVVENEPGFDDLENLIDPNNFVVLSPQGYELLSEQLLAGTLTPSEAVTLAGAHDVSRRFFEYGESLYLLIHSLPVLDAGRDYNIELIVSTSGTAIRRQLPVRDLIAGGGPVGSQSRLWIAAFPLIPNTNGVAPGPGRIRVRASLNTGGGSSRETSLNYTDSNPLAGGNNFVVANPIALEFPRSDAASSLLASAIGRTTSVYGPNVQGNGSGAIDAGTFSGPVPETSAGPQPGGFFGPNAVNTGDLVSHASAGAQRMNVLDRSLSFLLFGPGRGLPNVRLSSDDLLWQITPGNPAAQRNVYKPLSLNGISYPGFEDLPARPNRSLDYPDIDRSALAAARTRLSRVENPLFSTVALTPPNAADADITAYRTTTGFDDQLTRTLTATPFDLTLNVPRFQPASGPMAAGIGARPGYRGIGQVYIDTGSSSQPGFNGTDVHRVFVMGARIAPDERIRVATPVIDLGSMPAGAGWNGGPPSGPASRGILPPGSSTSAWRPDEPDFAADFRRYEVLNEGNVNLLNLRLARGWQVPNGQLTPRFQPFELLGLGMNENAYLPSDGVVFTDIDAIWSPTRSIDPLGRVFLQKPRPGDLVATRLSPNPVRRANANLGAASGTLMDSGAFPPGNPSVGAAPAMGTPSGQYRGTLAVIEDYVLSTFGAVLGSSNGLPLAPSQDNLEPFSDPGLTVTFNVRESRLTNRPTSRAAANVDNLVTGNEASYWSNLQPTAARHPSGTLLVAWASNRRTAANLPGFDARGRTPGDSSDQDSWNIYLATLVHGGPPSSTPINGSSITSANNFLPSGDRWFLPSAVVTGPMTVGDFNLPAGWTIEPGSVNLGAPALASSGFVDLLDPDTFSTVYGTGLTAGRLAFLATARASDDAGNTRTVYRVMAATVTLNGAGTLFSVDNIIGLQGDPFARKSPPAVIHSASGTTVFFTEYSVGSGQLMSAFVGAGGSTNVRPFRTGAFDSVGAPSATVRPNGQGFAPGFRAEIMLPARRRGRSHSELFITQATASAMNQFNPRSQTPFASRVDELSKEASSGAYWTPGVDIRTNGQDVLMGTPTGIDIFVVDRNGTRSIIVPGTSAFDADTGLVSADTTAGGSVSLNSASGAVRFSGAVFATGSRLFIRYSPYFVSIGTGSGANYRSVSAVWDFRWPAVTTFPDPENNKAAEIAYWYTASHALVAPGQTPRADRLVAVMNRTSGDGTQTARPYLGSYRIGVQLPTGVAVRGAGSAFGQILPADFSIDWGTGPTAVPAAERFYQVDPVSGKVYFQAGAEGRVVRITYRGVDADGTDLGLFNSLQFSPQFIAETQELAVPIEQAANESGMTLALDTTPATAFGASLRRPANLFWMFWTSTRAGSTDVYFQTLAPRFYVQPPSR